MSDGRDLLVWTAVYVVLLLTVVLALVAFAQWAIG